MKIGVPGGAKSPEGRHLHLAGEYSDLVIRPIVEKYGGIWRDDAPVVVDGNPDLVSAPQRYRALLERDSRLVSRTLTVSRRSRHAIWSPRNLDGIVCSRQAGFATTLLLPVPRPG